MRVGIGQINPCVGDIGGNTETILELIAEGRKEGCELVVFPELAIPGYIPLDIVWRPGFVASCEEAIERIRSATEGIAVILGSIGSGPRTEAANRFDLSSLSDGGGGALYNIAYLIEDGKIKGRFEKMHIPSYDVYNEKRYFTPGPGTGVEEIGGIRLGINVCEDIWVDGGPTEVQASLGAEWIVNISASPFYRGKPGIRRRLASERARENDVGIIYVNLVGGQDEIVFDGGSFVVDREGRLLFQGPRFEEGLFTFDLESLRPIEGEEEVEIGQIEGAIVTGIRDYLRKNGFSRAIVGLSGGIDSALVACLAAAAIGAEGVTGVFLRSEFSSEESREDAEEIARRLEIDYIEIPIEGIHRETRAALPMPAEGIVDENLQPRIRATILMAFANAKGAIVLSGGNKSEIAVGYNTLYGDTVGGLAPIADLYKEDVYLLAERFKEQIPPRVFEKPPSAELRADQRDEDDLPPYDLLDPLLRALIEENASREGLVSRGFDPELVDRALRLYYRSEYKRRQLPPGIKVSPKAFGIGRAVPITDRYRE